MQYVGEVEHYTHGGIHAIHVELSEVVCDGHTDTHVLLYRYTGVVEDAIHDVQLVVVIEHVAHMAAISHLTAIPEIFT